MLALALILATAAVPSDRQKMLTTFLADHDCVALARALNNPSDASAALGELDPKMRHRFLRAAEQSSDPIRRYTCAVMTVGDAAGANKALASRAIPPSM